jgi:cardiolipin synthase
MTDVLHAFWAWLLTNIVAIAGFLLGVVLVAYILLQKRSFSGTIAWLLAVILIPYIGVPLYLMFGGRKIRREADKKDELGLIQHEVPQQNLGPIERLLRSYGHPPAEGGHNLVLCRTGEETYLELMKMLHSAQESIYLATFIFRKDKRGVEVLEVLSEKARAGVRVCLLLDGVGCLHTRGRFLRPLVESGGQYAHFMPVFHRPFRGRANLRNHRKIIVIDEKKVLSGGTNIGREYMGPVPYEGRWRDLSFTLEGPAVQHYTQVFRYDWHFASGQWLPEIKPERLSDMTKGQAIVQVVPSGPDVPNDALYDAILTAVFAAQERFWVVTPYFIPDDSLTQALVLAARRGIDVRIILPRRSNHLLADLGRGIPLRELQRAGGKVLFFTPGMLHAKAVLMDHQVAILGSANIDYRSLLINYEIAMCVYSLSEIEDVETWIRMLFGGCKEGIEEAGLGRHLCESIVRILTPLL